MVKTIRPDADIENADWIKMQSFGMPEIETEEELKKRLKELGMTWAEFKKLPAYQGWLRKET